MAQSKVKGNRMGHSAKFADPLEGYKSFPGRHYYPSEQSKPKEFSRLKPAVKVFAWVAAALMLHGLLSAAGL
jgi:hypothetical protein